MSKPQGSCALPSASLPASAGTLLAPWSAATRLLVACLHALEKVPARAQNRSCHVLQQTSEILLRACRRGKDLLVAWTS